MLCGHMRNLRRPHGEAAGEATETCAGHSGKVWDGANCAPQNPGRGFMGALTAQPKAAH